MPDTSTQFPIFPTSIDQDKRRQITFEVPVYIELRPKRYLCKACKRKPTTTQRLSWYKLRSPNTKAYEKWLLRMLINSTVADVARKFNISDELVSRECADTVRKQEIKRLKQGLSKAEYETIKGALWPFRKSPEDLKDEEQSLLNRLFSYSPKLKQAYQLREELTQIVERTYTKSGAKCAIRAWCKAGAQEWH